jgi:membrane associated rhomboid family serine protease
LVVACGLVALLSSFGASRAPIAGLFISEYDVQGGGLGRLIAGLPEVRHGQLWRLVSPILIHFGVMHLFFNALWLWDLGGMVERRQGWGRLLVLVLGIAVPSNIAQFLMSGPMFGGMSGVVYGLIGYVWLRGEHDPASGLFLHSSTVAMMAVWYFLCLFGVIPGVANTVHTVGLAVGLAWGYFSALWARRR